MACVWQPSKDCVQKTLKRLEEKVAGKVLRQVLYSLAAPDRVLQQRTATALARLVKEHDLKLVFVDRRGLDILLHLLVDPASTPATQREAAGELGLWLCLYAGHHGLRTPRSSNMLQHRCKGWGAETCIRSLAHHGVM